MNRGNFVAATASSMLAAPLARRRPNFIFIYTDDQRGDAIRALGRQPWLGTSNLEVGGGADH